MLRPDQPTSCCQATAAVGMLINLSIASEQLPSLVYMQQNNGRSRWLTAIIGTLAPSI